MQPRTKQQVLVYDLAQQMSELTTDQEQWAIDKCTKHYGYMNKSGIACMDCGTRFQDYIFNLSGKCVCPNCNTKLEIVGTLKRNLKQMRYFALVEVHGGFQVVRYFELNTYHEIGELTRVRVHEVISQWLLPNGKFELIAKNRNTFNNNSFNGMLEIRDRKMLNVKYDMIPHGIYPKMKVLPIYKRNGFKGNFHDVSCYNFFNDIISYPMAETLLKAKQISLFRHRSVRAYDVERKWSSIKTCIRNGYIVKDAVTWIDYLDLLDRFNKDLNNPLLVCPPDLDAQHNIYVAKRDAQRAIEQDAQNRLNEQRRLEAKKMARRSLKKKDADYKKDKAPFLGMEFTDGNIVVKVLDSINEFKAEAEAHNHCVYTNDYFDKKKSLILSAQVNGKRVETVEVYLDVLKINQSRGFQNKASEYNEQILNLVNKNLNKISQVYSKSLKTA